MAEATDSVDKVEVYTYHCLCTQLVLASTTTLEKLSKRTSDKSLICALPKDSVKSHYATLLDTSLDSKPTVIRLEDGFEKRYFQKCARCDLIVAYHLDKSQYEESETGCKGDVAYILPGGLLSTQDMQRGKNMEQEIGRIAVQA